jgi:tetratricopeptide (TPR) repeat protein
VFANVNNQPDRGAALAERAVSVNPNVPMAWAIKGWTDAYRSDFEKASDAFDQTIRLDPFDRDMILYAMFGKSWVFLLLRRIDEALAWAQRMIAQRPYNITALMMLEHCYFAGGRVAEADAVVARIRTAYPNLRASWMRQTYCHEGPAEQLALIEHTIDRLRLPE